MALSGRVTKLRKVGIGSGFATWGGNVGGGFGVYEFNVAGKPHRVEVVMKNDRIAQVRDDNQSNKYRSWNNLSKKVQDRVKKKIRNDNFDNEVGGLF